MKINKVVVLDLFGLFNHEIPFKGDRHITIIHGPNGFGKTKLLQMINFLFNLQWEELIKIPFKDFILEFDDDSQFSIHREIFNPKDIREKFNDYCMIFRYSEKKKSIKEYTYVPYYYKRLLDDDDIFISRRFSQKNYIIKTKFRNAVKMDDYFVDSEIEDPSSEWIKETLKNLNVYLIETQRLLRFSDADQKSSEESSKRSLIKANVPIPAVVKYSNDLVLKIKDILVIYGELSQSLDRSFPIRLVESTPLEDKTLDELKKDFLELEKKRKSLEIAGLLKKEEINIEQLLKIDRDKLNVLSVYVNDVEKKLGTLEDLYRRIDLLVNIINSRFKYKKFSIEQDKGFVLTSENGENIPLEVLSSGEQHELVLFYELLFDVKSNSLILIDEPELSLHVFWQEQFLGDLQKITQLIGFDALIATHSPDIINDRWDLTVELKGIKPHE